MEVQPKFKCSDGVWVYVDPRSLVEVTEVPIFKCIVEQIEVKLNYSFPDEVTERKVFCTLGLGFDNLHKEEGEVFLTREEAVAHGLSKYTNCIEKMEEKLLSYRNVYKQMRGVV